MGPRPGLLYEHFSHVPACSVGLEVSSSYSRTVKQLPCISFVISSSSRLAFVMARPENAGALFKAV